MEFEVKLDANAVQKQIVASIIESSLGEKIAEAIEKSLKTPYLGKNVIEQALEQEVVEQVRIRCRELIREPGEVRDQIEQSLKEAMTPVAIDLIVSKFVHDLGLITAEDIRR